MATNQEFYTKIKCKLSNLCFSGWLAIMKTYVASKNMLSVIINKQVYTNFLRMQILQI